MTTDDTSREALIESLRGPLANVLCNASNFPRRAQPHILGADMGPLIDKTAEAVVDAVVAAIKRAEAAEAEVERLRIQWDRSGKNDLIERAEAAEQERDRLAAEKAKRQAEAWERGYMFAFAQERGDYTHSRPVPDYMAEDIRSWNPYITEETP